MDMAMNESMTYRRQALKCLQLCPLRLDRMLPLPVCFLLQCEVTNGDRWRLGNFSL